MSGHATVAGISFQADVATIFAAHMLGGDSLLSLAVGSVPTAIHLETTSPVDDIVLELENGGRAYVNVKRNLTVSRNPKSELGSVVDQFVRQYLSGNELEEPLTRNDYLVLAVDHSRHIPFLRSLASVLGRLEGSSVTDHLMDLATSKEQKAALRRFVELTESAWNRHSPSDIRQDELRGFLARIRIMWISPEADRANAVRRLAHGVLKNPNQAESAYDAIKNVVLYLAEAKSGFDVEFIRREISRRGIILAEKPNLSADIEQLRKRTAINLGALEHYGRIKLNGADGKEVRIVRGCTALVVDKARHESFLLIGDPGSGKSGILQAAAGELAERGVDVVVLNVDAIDARNIDDLSEQLGLSRSLIDILVEWRPEANGVLAIDSLDASRGGVTKDVITDLIREVRARAPQWNVLASIRKFDLRYGTVFRDLFRGEPTEPGYADPTFAKVAHINVPVLSDSEVAQTARQWSSFKTYYDSASPSTQSLMRSPFNIFLLSTVIDAQEPSPLASRLSQVALLSEFWARRVTDMSLGGPLRAEATLRRMTRRMVEGRQLFVSEDAFDASDAEVVQTLLRNGVLQRLPWQRIAFAHHVIFDFAVAKLAMLSAGPEQIVKFLESSSDALIVAPAFLMALQSVWEDDVGHVEFWRLALDVIGSGSGDFLKTIAARVAASRTESKSDVNYLITELSSNEAKGATRLATHVFSVLVADVEGGVPNFSNASDPWCEIAALAAHANRDIRVWPMKAVVASWSKKATTDTQMGFLRDCADLMLREVIVRNISEPGAVSVAVDTLVRASNDADRHRLDVLRLLLQEERLAGHAHQDMFALSRRLIEISRTSPDLAAEIVETAFLNSVDSDETTSMGGAVLPLTSTKRQDYDIAVHQIKEILPKFIEACPREAVRAVRTILIKTTGYDRGQTYEVGLGSSVVVVTEDLSSVWWAPNAHRHQNSAHLLDAVVNGCEALANDPTRPLEDLLYELIGDYASAGMVAAAMAVACSHPEESLGLSADLLSSSSLLQSMDTRYWACKLLRAVHGLMSDQQKLRVENAIAAVEGKNLKRALVGQLRPEDIGLPELALEREGIDDQEELSRPPFSFEVTSRNADRYWWLESEGVDLNEASVASLLEAKERVEAAASEPAESAYWHAVVALYESAKQTEIDNEALRNTVWDALATACDKVADGVGGARLKLAYPQFLEIVRRCLDTNLRPSTVRSEESEKEFEKSASWGSPAPRVPAATALLSFIRSLGEPVPDASKMLLKLARDGSPVVRQAVLGRVNAVCLADPQLAKELAEIGFEEETNLGVISFFTSAFASMAAIDQPWSNVKIAALARKVAGQGRQPPDQLVHSILHSWLKFADRPAMDVIDSWRDELESQRKPISELLHGLRYAISADCFDESYGAPELRDRAVALFSALSKQIASADTKAWSTGDPDRIETTASLVRQAANQLYFASGARAEAKHDAGPDDRYREVGGRFLDALKSAALSLAERPYPPATHVLLETIEPLVSVRPGMAVELLIKAVNAGAGGGYLQDSMAVELVVKIVKELLADHSGLVSSNPQYREGVLSILNQFAETGWAEPRKLVYSLPEILR